jgi:hypothetical protein
MGSAASKDINRNNKELSHVSSVKNSIARCESHIMHNHVHICTRWEKCEHVAIHDTYSAKMTEMALTP